MRRDGVDISSDEPVAEARKRAASMWVVFGTMLFVLAFVLGWRAAGPKSQKREAAPTGEFAA